MKNKLFYFILVLIGIALFMHGWQARVAEYSDRIMLFSTSHLGERILGIILAVGGVCCLFDGGSSKTGTGNGTSLLSKLYEQEDLLVKRCYDERTCFFNWDYYFQNRDAILYCGQESVVKQLSSDLEYCGRRQIYYINSGLQTYLAGRMSKQMLLKELKKIEPNIILNLEVLCGGGDARKCSQNVKNYRTMLYDIIYDRTSWDRTTIERLVKMTN